MPRKQSCYYGVGSPEPGAVAAKLGITVTIETLSNRRVQVVVAKTDTIGKLKVRHDATVQLLCLVLFILIMDLVE